MEDQKILTELRGRKNVRSKSNQFSNFANKINIRPFSCKIESIVDENNNNEPGPSETGSKNKENRMVTIPMAIVIDLLKKDFRSPHKLKHTKQSTDAETKEMSSNCFRCSKPITKANYVNCTKCWERGHFGCLRRAKLIKNKKDALQWKCRMCL